MRRAGDESCSAVAVRSDSSVVSAAAGLLAHLAVRARLLIGLERGNTRGNLGCALVLARSPRRRLLGDGKEREKKWKGGKNWAWLQKKKKGEEVER